MLGLSLAQTATDYSYNTTTTAGENAAMVGLGIFMVVLLLVGLAASVVMIIAQWKVFEKAGRPGWASLIPFYNLWILAEMAGKPGWWGLVPLAAVVPVVGFVVVFGWMVLYVLICIELAKAFGKEPAFAALLIIVPIVGFPMLAFGDAKYKAPPTAPPAATPAA